MILRSIPGTDPSSVMQELGEHIKREEKARQRPWHSVHSSSHIDCEYRLTGEMAAVPAAFNDFNLSNRLAAESGDDDHEMKQRLFKKFHMAVLVPSFHDDPIIRRTERNRGILYPAIEVPIKNYLFPLFPHQEKAYRRWHFKNPPLDYYRQFWTYYRRGVRIDAVIHKELSVGGRRNYVTEIKTVKTKYFTTFETFFKAYTKAVLEKKPLPRIPEKIFDWLCQHMEQLYWWRDPVTGERSDWGLLLIVNRDDPAKVIDVYVKYNPDLMASLLAKMERDRLLFLRLKSGEKAPFGITSPSENSCGWCKLQPICPDPNKLSHIGLRNQAAQAKKEMSFNMTFVDDPEAFEYLVRTN